MTIQELRENLKSMLEIKTNTFEHFNLKLINVGFSSFDDDGWFDIIFEIESITKGFDVNLWIKANFYDSDNNIIATGSTLLNSDFAGYDTLLINMHEADLAFEAKRIVVFISKQG